MYYTIYKISNKIDGKIYIGSHKTKSLDDSYMGSGKYLKYAQDKHGMENFTKEILFVFDTPEEMYAKEAELVDEEFIAENNTYNIKVGGFGGFDYLNSTGLNNSSKSVETLSKPGLIHAARLMNDPEYRQQHSDRSSRSMSNRHQRGECTYDNFKGKKHSEETRKKMSETKQKISFQVGESNSQYGTTWIWHEMFGNKKIKKEFLVDYLDQGWYKTYKPGYRINELCMRW